MGCTMVGWVHRGGVGWCVSKGCGDREGGCVGWLGLLVQQPYRCVALGADTSEATSGAYILTQIHRKWGVRVD